MPVRKKTIQIEAEDQVDWAPKIEQREERTGITDLRSILDDIKTRQGIIGYIIRGPTSASVDIKDPSKIIDYAALSSESAESSENLSNTFGLGKVAYVTLEGKNLKVLSMTRGEQQISIFMEKNVDHDRIYREIAE
jgi:predicted regulator of Ras-like GTPase activity (Roadblock/LC7/MglB family)